MAVLTNLSVPLKERGNLGTLMPKLQYRFRVTFINLGGEGADEGSINQLTNNVISVARPNLTFDPVTIDTYNSRIFIPGKHTWEGIDIVFRDDISSNVVRALDRQLAKQVDMFSQSSAMSAGSFKFKTEIETLDGTNGPTANQAEQVNAMVLERWNLLGCHITNIRYGDNAYSASEPVQITVSIRFDNAEHIIEGQDRLSAPSYIQNRLIDSATDNGIALPPPPARG
jgi:hypothetical protein